MIPDITTPAIWLVATAILSYGLGSVSFGLVMSRLFGLGDPRSFGSGGTGATNILRTGNKWAAFLTLVLDAGKGAIAVLLARALFGEDAAQIAGFAAFLGHCYSMFLGFRGGKGVATYLGTMLALSFPVGIACCLIWLLTAGIGRISSLSALVSVALSPVAAWALGRPEMILLCIALAALVFLRHAANIQRLLDGTEPRIGAGK